MSRHRHSVGLLVGDGGPVAGFVGQVVDRLEAAVGEEDVVLTGGHAAGAALAVPEF